MSPTTKPAGLYSNATMHTPENITEEAMKVARELKADCVVSVGGGSTIGLGKAIAYRTDLPQIVVPTTYAGSEATPILGQTAGGRKTTLKSEKGVYLCLNTFVSFYALSHSDFPSLFLQLPSPKILSTSHALSNSLGTITNS